MDKMKVIIKKIFCKDKILPVLCGIGLLAVLLSVSGFFGYVESAKNYKVVLAGNSKSKTFVAENIQKSAVSPEEKQLPYVPEKTADSSPEMYASEAEDSRALLQGGKENTQSSINILFLGIDRTEERDRTLGIYRSDTIALAKINLDTKKVDIVCIPRDTYAYIPAVNRKDKINHAYAFGSVRGDGAKSTVEAVEGFIKYGTIDYYFTLDMEPIPQIVDDLNGVELDVEIDMKTYGASLSKGFQLLDGKKAFDYIHWRYSAKGDIDRIQRQQKFFKAMYTKLREKDQLVNAAKLAITYEKYIKTNMSTKQLLSLAVLAKDISSGSTTFHTVPGEGKYINGVSYWVANEEETDSLLKQIFQSNK